MNPLYPSLLSEPDRFIGEVEKRLGEVPLDYAERYLPSFSATGPDRRLLAGTLVLLTEKPASREGAGWPELNLLLIKRSNRVSQGGDLSSPGGMLQPNLDRLLRLLIVTGILPGLRGIRRRQLLGRDKRTFYLVTLFLANAIRETWEEIGLRPRNIHFLGALPTYSLSLFARTIFPLVALIKENPVLRLNHEVEKIVSIPLLSFLKEENYGLLRLEMADRKAENTAATGDFPCFIHQDHDTREVLWGATFQIVTSFMKLFFALPTPGRNAGSMVVKTINDHYLKGYKRDLPSPIMRL